MKIRNNILNKKLVASLLTASLALSAVGCGKTDNNQSEDTNRDQARKSIERFTEEETTEEKGVYIFKRMTEEQTILVAMNCSEKEQEYELKEEDLGNGLQLLLDSDWDIYGGSKPKGEETAAILKLAPFSAKYYFRK